jgi:hypothetical protein
VTARCRSASCQAEIDWAQSVPEAGVAPSLMPVDRASADDPSGNLAVWREGRTLRFRVLAKGEGPRPGEHRGISHYASCPDAASWRQT